MTTKRSHSPAGVRQDEAQRCRQTMQRLLGSLAVHLPAEHPSFRSAFLLEYQRAAKAHTFRQRKGAS